MKTNKNQYKLKKKFFTSVSILNILLSIAINTNAQSDDKISIEKTFPFQITLITPIGSHGFYSHEITYNASINLFAGICGGINGAEISVFGSLIKGNVKGAQFAGFGNIVLGKTNGSQFAGNFNYTKDSLTGSQFAGFANISNNYAKALQIAGFSNVSIGSIKGTQLAGFANITLQEADAFQAAGFANYSKGNTKGQLSGFANINTGVLKGIQLAGFANINKGKTQGIQLSGFVNVTKQLKGFQLGVFNYVDSLESGIPVGVFSIVKNGYRTFEISSNETLYGIASFKTGVKRFYNIISFGASYKNDKTLWGWGYGIGTLMPIKNNWDLSIELISHHINENKWYTDNLNFHNKLQITTSKKITQNLHVFGGISWNVNVSETIDKDGNAFESSITPWNVFDKTYGNDTNVKMYPGFTAGIRF